MMNAHIEIMKLAIGYTCVGVFITTAIATVLSLFNVINLENEIKSKLNKILLIEVVTISIAIFMGLMNINHNQVVNEVEKTQIELKKSDELLKLAPARVYIQIGDESQRPKIVDLQKKIRDAGYIAPGIENVGKGKLPENTSVRYFNDVDEKDSIKIAEIIKSFGYVKVDIKRIYNMSAKEGTLEIWLGKKD